MKAADLTRNQIIEHATDVFAENGFAGASVRVITSRAAVNQAAISYHFGSKEGLYSEVLRLALAALDAASPLDDETIDQLESDEAVRLFIRQQIMSLLKQNEFGRYVRIFAWEALLPTETYLNYMVDKKFPIMRQAYLIVQKYLPDESQESLTITALWLAQQVAPFIRLYENHSKPPLSLKMDGDFLGKLSFEIGEMAVAGLKTHMLLKLSEKVAALGPAIFQLTFAITVPQNLK